VLARQARGGEAAKAASERKALEAVGGAAVVVTDGRSLCDVAEQKGAFSVSEEGAWRRSDAGQERPFWPVAALEALTVEDGGGA
jgi:hypothetical protein